MITVKNKMVQKKIKIYYDLHFHSTFSDGKYPPKKLAEILNMKKITIASLTDHDSISGYQEFKEYFKGTAVTGVELSTHFHDEDIHILGYGFDPNNEIMLSTLNKYKKYRKNRIYSICEKLEKLNIKILPDTIFEMVGSKTSLGRPHVAQALLDANFVRSAKEAFISYLGYDCPAYVPKKKMSVEYAIELIHNAGGIAVLAHPGLYKNRYLLEDIVTYSIDGIELRHPSNSQKLISEILDIAKKFNLITTGGSDFHQLNWNGDNSLGKSGVTHDEWIKLKNHFINKNTFISKNFTNNKENNV
ncbi:MAG: PHP domain-containing protein [Candidatus Marinimicrobia bacterium]|nr:PHP domain-containing protein [Candidatus Neomarinimicrobiota bacterium]